MGTFTKELLSGSSDGQAVGVVATGSPGTTIHTADATALDEIWIYAMNVFTSKVNLTLEWGGTGVLDVIEQYSIDKESGLLLIVPGLLLTNSKIVRAYASQANGIQIHGWVNRISQP